MLLGIFGGSFDPVHNGHLLLAECCAKQAALDTVWFLPTASQPLKPQGPVANDQDRLEMLRLALDDRAEFEVSALEIDRGGVSYSFDTLTAIRAENPQAELFFLMGADSLADLPHWHRPAEVCTLATLLVVRRAGTPEPDFSVLQNLVSAERLDAIRRHQVEMPATPISSSQIRSQIAADKDWQASVPEKVAAYICEHGLYTS